MTPARHGRPLMRDRLFPSSRGSLALRNYHLHTADHSAYQAHFYAVRVSGRISENLVNGSFCQFPGMLILFLNDLHPGSRLDIRSFSPVHRNSLSQLGERPLRLTSAIRHTIWRRLHGMVRLFVFLRFQYQESVYIRKCGLLALES
jgi:hypothetical protein